MLTKLFLPLMAVSMLFGCASTGGAPDRNVIWNMFGRSATTLSLNAERRLVMFRPHEGKFCAEAPPDAADNITRAFLAGLAANAKIPNVGEGGVSGAVASTMSSTITQLFTRSQGVQWFRDGAYQLCQSRLNDQLTDEQYIKEWQRLVDRVFWILLVEVSKPVSPPPQNAAAQLSEAQKQIKGVMDKAIVKAFESMGEQLVKQAFPSPSVELPKESTETPAATPKPAS